MKDYIFYLKVRVVVQSRLTEDAATEEFLQETDYSFKSTSNVEIIGTTLIESSKEFRG